MNSLDGEIIRVLCVNSLEYFNDETLVCVWVGEHFLVVRDLPDHAETGGYSLQQYCNIAVNILKKGM